MRNQASTLVCTGIALMLSIGTQAQTHCFQFGTPGFDTFYGVYDDPTGPDYMLTGRIHSVSGLSWDRELLATKFDNQGNLLWSRAMGQFGSIDFYLASLVLSNGNTIVSGYFNNQSGNPNEVPQPFEIFCVDPTGDLVWSQVSRTTTVHTQRMLELPSGHILMVSQGTGSVVHVTGLNPNTGAEVGSEELDFPTLNNIRGAVLTSDGGLAICGMIGQNEFRLTKVNSPNDFSQRISIPNMNDELATRQVPHDMILTSTGNYLVVGEHGNLASQGNYEGSSGFAVLIDPNGVPIISTRIADHIVIGTGGYNITNTAHVIRVDRVVELDNGHFVMAGYQGQLQPFLIELDANLNMVASQTFRQTDGLSGAFKSLIPNLQGGVVAVGESLGATSEGIITVTDNMLQSCCSFGAPGYVSPVTPSHNPDAAPSQSPGNFDLVNEGDFLNQDFGNAFEDCNSSHAPLLGIDAAGGNDEVTVFPNPNEGAFQIGVNGTFESEYNVQILDISGALIYERPDLFGNQDINLPDVGPGIYLLKASDGQSQITRRLVVR